MELLRVWPLFLVGEDPASQVYVNSKVRKCAELGIHSEKVVLSKDASQDEVFGHREAPQ